MKTKLILKNRIGQWLAGICLLAAPIALHASSTNTLGDALNNTGLTWFSNPTNQAGAWFTEDTVTHDGDAAVQSGVTGFLKSSTLSASIVGPGTLSFWWKISAKTNTDNLKLSLDNSSGSLVSLSGDKDWQQETVSVPSGVHTMNWRYSAFGSPAGFANAGWVDQVTFYGTLPQVSIEPATQTASVGSNVSFFANTVSNGPSVSYQWKLNGADISGATGKTLSLTAVGRKDRGWYAVSAANGNGSVLVSNATLKVPVIQTLTALTPISGGGVQVTWTDGDNAALTAGDLTRFTGQATADVLNTNVFSWETLPGSLSLSNGAIILTDPDAWQYAHRYYRIMEKY